MYKMDYNRALSCVKWIIMELTGWACQLCEKTYPRTRPWQEHRETSSPPLSTSKERTRDAGISPGQQSNGEMRLCGRHTRLKSWLHPKLKDLKEPFILTALDPRSQKSRGGQGRAPGS